MAKKSTSVSSKIKTGSKILAESSSKSIIPSSALSLIPVDSNISIDSKLSKLEIIDIIISDILRDAKIQFDSLNKEYHKLLEDTNKTIKSAIEDYFRSKHLISLAKIYNDIHNTKDSNIVLCCDGSTQYMCYYMDHNNDKNKRTHLGTKVIIYHKVPNGNSNLITTIEIGISASKISEIINTNKIDIDKVSKIKQQVDRYYKLVNTNRTELRVEITKQLISKSSNGKALVDMIDIIRENVMKNIKVDK